MLDGYHQEERGSFMGTAGIVCLLLYIPVAVLFGLVDKYK
jgi:hypothetical protein